MPWERMSGDEQRMQFVVRAVSGKEPRTARCREFGISRPTGYLWRRRYELVATARFLCRGLLIRDTIPANGHGRFAFGSV